MYVVAISLNCADADALWSWICADAQFADF